MPTDKLSTEPDEGADDPAMLVAMWRSEIERAKKDMDDWSGDAKKIAKRFRAEEKGRKSQYNVLWSNVQTMAPALYHRSPKAVVQRRYLDRDPIGRVACRILQRALQYQIDTGDLHKTVKRAVKDRLLGGRGTAWLSYLPEFEPMPIPEDVGSEDPDVNVEPLERIKREIVLVEYVHPEDFVHEPGRTWDEVGWVAKRAYMTRDKLVERFPDVGADVPLTQSPQQDDSGPKRAANTSLDKAEVWEIWNKADREVLFIAADFDQPLDRKPDPLELEGFFPCPEPLYASTTNDTLKPIPDYAQYETQAKEMDNITKRIGRLVAAVRVKGVYDGSFAQLGDLLDDAGENQVYPVDNWAQFAQANGFKGAMDFMEIEPFVKALGELYKARDANKAEIYEITGLSDVLRGQGDPDETATGVREKGRFATLRLQDQQEAVAVFVRDIVRIMAEITCTLFQPQTLAEMASAEEMDELQIPAPPPMPMMPPGGAPLQPQRIPMMGT